MRLSDAVLQSNHRTFTVVAAVIFGSISLWLLVGLIGDWRSRGVPPAETAIPVTVLVVQPTQIEFSANYLGRASASKTVEIRSRVNGFLNEQFFEEGSEVAANDMMFQIDPKPFEVDVQVAKARVENARARLTQAERQFDRYTSLFAQGAATETELEEWETAMQVAISDIELYEAQLVQAELELGYTTIRSPIRGMVGQAIRDVGAYVEDGSNSLLAIVEQVDPIHIRFAISERDALAMRRMRDEGKLIGPSVSRAEVRVTLGDGSIYPYLGRVNYVDPAIDTSTATFTLRAEVQNPEHSLRPGQFLDVSLVGLQRPSVIVVPKQAVLQTPTNAAVFVVGEDDRTAELRAVELGPWIETGWIIDTGLAAGDRIIIDNIGRLYRNATIEIESESAPGEMLIESTSGDEDNRLQTPSQHPLYPDQSSDQDSDLNDVDPESVRRGD